MRKRVLLIALCSAACAALLVAQGGRGGAGKAKAKGPAPCDRACLEDFVNQYLDALVAHNPFGLPLASRVKFSENDQLLDLGDGLWNVTNGVGTYKLYIADVPGQQVGFLGTVRANDRPTTLALRLKIDNRRISEIETLVSVSNTGGPPPAAGPGGAKGGPPGAAKGKGGPPPTPAGAPALEALGKPDAVFLEAAPEGQRQSRDQLIAAANAYFDAMESGNASLAQIDPQCNRIENGVQVTNNPAAGPGRGSTVNTSAMTCAEQISSKLFANYQVIYPRRFPVVDEERQLVFGFFMHQQPGDLMQVESPGRGAYKFSDQATQPGFVEMAQVFKIAGGKVRRMEAMTTAVPYGTPNPFFNDDWRRAKK
jgi:hypothetical protein